MIVTPVQDVASPAPDPCHHEWQRVRQVKRAGVDQCSKCAALRLSPAWAMLSDHTFMLAP